MTASRPAAVNIRGTSGSGKSYAIHQLIKLYPTVEKVNVKWRDQPIGYLCSAPTLRPLYIVGHYETTCGGCDTLDSIDQAYKYINQHIDEGHHVVYEGLVVQSDVNRCIELGKKADRSVVFLSTPISICLNDVATRRDEKGKTSVFNPRNTVIKHQSFPPQKRKFEREKVPFYEYDRQQTLQYLKLSFGLDYNPVPPAYVYPELTDYFHNQIIPVWVKALIEVAAEGSLQEREVLAMRFKSTIKDVLKQPHDFSLGILRQLYEKYPVYQDNRTVIGYTPTNLPGLMGGIRDAAWQKRREAMREGYIQNTVRAARVMWADWAYSKAIDAEIHNILNIIDGAL